jgi:hypothetical protein
MRYQCKKQIPIGSFGHKNNSQFNFWKARKKNENDIDIFYNTWSI